VIHTGISFLVKLCLLTDYYLPFAAWVCSIQVARPPSLDLMSGLRFAYPAPRAWTQSASAAPRQLTLTWRWPLPASRCRSVVFLSFCGLQQLIEQHCLHRVLAYHGWFDGSDPSPVGVSECVVATDPIVAVGVADEHAESVSAIRSAAIILLESMFDFFISVIPFIRVLTEWSGQVFDYF